jgi:putative flippase GtrA
MECSTVSNFAIRVAGQYLRFALVGVSNTLLSTAVYAGFVRFGVPYLIASGLAFAIGALNSYVLNRRWTFRSRGRRTPELARFACVQAVGLLVNLMLLAAFVQDAHLPHLLGQPLAFPLASVVTFALSRQWAFRDGRRWTAAESG